MSDDQKPPRPERVHTLSLDFNAFSMEPYVNSLLKKMQKVVPSFHVNVAYKSVPVSHLFSTNSKAVLQKEETSNVVYEFTCECESNYVGHSGRALIERISEHQRLSSAKELYWHIQSCPQYKEKQKVWQPPKATKKKLTLK